MGRTWSTYGKNPEMYAKFCWEDWKERDLLRKSRRTWNDNIKKDLKEVDCDGRNSVLC